MLKCVICGKEFIREKKQGKPPKTCSLYCRHEYKIKQIMEWGKNHPEKFNEYQKTYQRKHPEKILASGIEWRKRNQEKVKEYNKKSLATFLKKNPDYFKKHIKLDYSIHKGRWKSRKITLDLIKKGDILLNDWCRCCKTKNNLEIHHEIYPETKEQIIQAVKETKIYNLCKNCHNFISSFTASY